MAGGGGDAESELNLVPYMDIMVNLMMFMLVVTAYIVEFREAPVLAPAYKSGDDPPGAEKPKPYLSVNVVPAGFVVFSSGGDIERKDILLKDGEYPYVELQGYLRATQSGNELAPNLVLAADGAVPYKILVRTMDAARQDKQGPLFPGVTLALAVTQK